MAQSIFALDTPYTRKAVFDYGRSGNDASCQSKNLQHIAGTVYKGANKDMDGYFCCTLYIYFEEKRLGVNIQRLSNCNRDWTVEDLQKSLENSGYCSFDAFMAMLRSEVEKGKYIPNAYIMFAGRFDPNLADDARELRELINRREEEQRRQEKQKEAEKYRAEALLRNAQEVRRLQKQLAVLRQYEGRAYNEEITLYRDNGIDYHTYFAFNLLADIYGVAIPPNVRGWIKRSCGMVSILNGEVSQYWHRKGKSETFCSYMRQIIEKVKHDPHDEAFERWLSSNGFAYSSEDAA